MCSSSVGVVYIVHLRIVFLKGALQKRGSMEHMEPPLDPPLNITSEKVRFGRGDICMLSGEVL